MQVDPAWSGQRVVDRLPNDVVGEPQPADQAGRGRLVEQLRHPVGLLADEIREDVAGPPGPGDRRGSEQGRRVGRHPGHPLSDGFVYRNRDLGRIGACRDRVGEFPHEVGLSTGAAMDLGGPAGPPRPARDRPGEVGHLAGREPAQRDPLDRTAQPAQRRRLVRADVVMPVGPQQQQGPRRGPAGQVVPQVDRRSVRPLQVVEHDHQRAPDRVAAASTAATASNTSSRSPTRPDPVARSAVSLGAHSGTTAATAGTVASKEHSGGSGNARSTWLHPQNAGACSACQHVPQATRLPTVPVHRDSTVLLPIPADPEIRTATGSRGTPSGGSVTVRSAASSAANTACRPTNTAMLGIVPRNSPEGASTARGRLADCQTGSGAIRVE